MSSKVKIIFKNANDESVVVDATVGDTLLDIARDHDISIEGACGGSCACATCHVWIADPWFDQLKPASEAEENMLDNGQEIGPNSRLCCQIEVTPEMDGMTITVPKSSENISGHHH